MINNVFVKTIKNSKKHRYTKLVTTEGGSSHLVLKPNYHKRKIIKTEVIKNAQLYLALSKKQLCRQKKLQL